MNIRLIGSIGLYYWLCKKDISNIRFIKDIDLIFQKKEDLNIIINVLLKNDFEYSKEALILTEGERVVFYPKRNSMPNFTIDLICNPFNFAQKINFNNNDFCLDKYSLGISNLILTKMQKVEL